MSPRPCRIGPARPGPDRLTPLCYQMRSARAIPKARQEWRRPHFPARQAGSTAAWRAGWSRAATPHPAASHLREPATGRRRRPGYRHGNRGRPFGRRAGRTGRNRKRACRRNRSRARHRRRMSGHLRSMKRAGRHMRAKRGVSVDLLARMAWGLSGDPAIRIRSMGTARSSRHHPLIVAIPESGFRAVPARLASFPAVARRRSAAAPLPRRTRSGTRRVGPRAAPPRHGRQAVAGAPRRRVRSAPPVRPKPTIIIAQLAGSGTASTALGDTAVAPKIRVS